MSKTNFEELVDKAISKWKLSTRLSIYRHSDCNYLINNFYYRFGLTDKQIETKIKHILYGDTKPTKEEYALIKIIFTRLDRTFKTTYSTRISKYFNKSNLRTIENSCLVKNINKKIIKTKDLIEKCSYELSESKNSKLKINREDIDNNYIPALKSLIEYYLIKNRCYDGNAMGFIKANYQEFAYLYNYNYSVTNKMSSANKKSIIRWSQKVLRGEILLSRMALTYFYLSILQCNAEFISQMNDVIKKAVDDKKWEPKSYYLWKKENNLAVPKSFKF